MCTYSSLFFTSYTNCLIAVLNNRRLNSPSSSRGQTYITSNSSSTQNVRGGSQLSGGVSSGGGPRKDVKIRVVRDVEYIGDADYELGEIQVSPLIFFKEFWDFFFLTNFN